jgi:hypothetical protein
LTRIAKAFAAEVGDARLLELGREPVNLPDGPLAKVRYVAMCHQRKSPTLFNHLVGAAEQRRGDIDAERFSAAPTSLVVPFFIHIAGPHGQRRVTAGRACAR